MLRRFAGFLVAACLFPSATAFNVLLGSEEDPELVGHPDTVTYDPKYTGPRDHDYLDLLAGWFGYDNATDVIRFTMKVKDATKLQNPMSGYSIGCQVSGTLTVSGQKTGTLIFVFNQQPDASRTTRVIYESPTADSTGYYKRDLIGHNASITLDKPGYYSFQVNRTPLLNLGNEFENPEGTCAETYDPAGTAGILGIYRNQERENSKSVFSFADQRRLRTASGELEPWEATPTTTAATEASPVTDTSGLAFAGVAFCLAIAAIRRRRA